MQFGRSSAAKIAAASLKQDLLRVVGSQEADHFRGENFPAADQEAMRIVFEDGTSQECSPTDQREIIAEAGFHPVQGIPKRLKRVSDNPPAWANLVVVRCSVIVPDHYVMTSAGLKRVARVER